MRFKVHHSVKKKIAEIAGKRFEVLGNGGLLGDKRWLLASQNRYLGLMHARMIMKK